MSTYSIGSRLRPLVAAAILVTALLAGVPAAPRAAADDATPAAGDTASPAAEKLVLRGGWTNDPDNLNPFIGYESSSYEIWRLNYNLLTGWDAATLEPKGELAESWTVSDDGKTWDFKIREGVTWHDGEPLTARDVAFTFNYIIENEMSAFTLYTEFIDRVETPDDYTARFICSQPKSNMLGLWVFILPEHIWSKVSGEDAGSTYVNEPPIVGSGPFQVVEYKKGDFTRLVANKDYWGGAPTIDEVVFETYQSADTLAQDVRSGRIDMAWNLPTAQLESLDELPDVVAHSYISTVLDELGFNCYEGKASLGHPVLLDPAFRRALNYAVDKDKIQQIAYSGNAIAGSTILLPDYYTDPDWHWQPPEPYTFDLEKAGTELDAAGYTDGDGDGLREYKGEPIELRLWARAESDVQQRAAKLIAGWFQQIGLKIKLEVMDDGVMSDRMYNYDEDENFAPDFDMFLWGWGIDIDPNFVLSIFTSGQIESWSDCNWSSEEYDELFEEQGRTIDPDERKAIIDRMQQILYEESPYIVTVYPADTEAYNVGKWDGWVRAPAKTGGVWYSGTIVDSYLNLKPKVAAQTDGGGSNTGLIVGIVVAAVVVVGIVVWIVLRRRPKTAEEE